MSCSKTFNIEEVVDSILADELEQSLDSSIQHVPATGPAAPDPLERKVEGSASLTTTTETLPDGWWKEPPSYYQAVRWIGEDCRSKFLAEWSNKLPSLRQNECFVCHKYVPCGPGTPRFACVLCGWIVYCSDECKRKNQIVVSKLHTLKETTPPFRQWNPYAMGHSQELCQITMRQMLGFARQQNKPFEAIANAHSSMEYLKVKSVTLCMARRVFMLYLPDMESEEVAQAVRDPMSCFELWFLEKEEKWADSSYPFFRFAKRKQSSELQRQQRRVLWCSIGLILKHFTPASCLIMSDNGESGSYYTFPRSSWRNLCLCCQKHYGTSHSCQTTGVCHECGDTDTDNLASSSQVFPTCNQCGQAATCKSCLKDGGHAKVCAIFRSASEQALAHLKVYETNRVTREFEGSLLRMETADLESGAYVGTRPSSLVQPLEKTVAADILADIGHMREQQKRNEDEDQIEQ